MKKCQDQILLRCGEYQSAGCSFILVPAQINSMPVFITTLEVEGCRGVGASPAASWGMRLQFLCKNWRSGRCWPSCSENVSLSASKISTHFEQQSNFNRNINEGRGRERRENWRGTSKLLLFTEDITNFLEAKKMQNKSTTLKWEGPLEDHRAHFIRRKRRGEIWEKNKINFRIF